MGELCGMEISIKLLKINCSFCEDGHYDWCKVTPHGSFDLHFSNNE